MQFFSRNSDGFIRIRLSERQPRKPLLALVLFRSQLDLFLEAGAAPALARDDSDGDESESRYRGMDASGLSHEEQDTSKTAREATPRMETSSRAVQDMQVSLRAALESFDGMKRTVRSIDQASR